MIFVFFVADSFSQGATTRFDPEIQRDFYLSTATAEYDLNPHTASYASDARLLNACYEGLFNYHWQTLAPTLALATSYKISRDKLRWTFTLRSDAFFSDGEKITAETVKSSWLRLFRTTGAPYASLLDCIKNVGRFIKGECGENEVGIIVRNENTLVLELENPTAHLPNILCHHAFAAVSENKNVFSGAYKIESYKGDVVVLEKNEKYWDAKNVAISKVTMSGNDNLDDNAWLYNSGRSDWVAGNFSAMKILDKSAIKMSAEFGTEYIFFSCKAEPWKSNPELRNALIAAVPWAEIRAGHLIAAKTLVYPTNGYIGVEGVEEFDAEEAKELMEAARKKAGLPSIETAIKTGETLQIVFGISDSEYQMKYAEILKNAWEPLGVELMVQKTPFARYYSSIASWNADLFVYSWVGDFADPVAFLELFRPESSMCECRWENAEFSALLKKAATTTDSDERLKTLSKAEQLIIDEGIIIPIAHNVSFHAIDLGEIGGWAINALDIHPFKDMYFKEKETILPKNMIVTQF